MFFELKMKTAQTLLFHDFFQIEKTSKTFFVEIEKKAPNRLFWIKNENIPKPYFLFFLNWKIAQKRGFSTYLKTTFFSCFFLTCLNWKTAPKRLFWIQIENCRKKTWLLKLKTAQNSVFSNLKKNFTVGVHFSPP